MRYAHALLLALGAAPAAVVAQGAPTVHGTVRTADGAPLGGANVFVLETLDGASSDSAGRFSFRVAGPIFRAQGVNS